MSMSFGYSGREWVRAITSVALLFSKTHRRFLVLDRLLAPPPLFSAT